MRPLVLLTALLLTACDGFPIFGPIFGSGSPEEPKGSITITLPCHDDQGHTFPCPAPAPVRAASDSLPGSETRF